METETAAAPPLPSGGGGDGAGTVSGARRSRAEFDESKFDCVVVPPEPADGPRDWAGWGGGEGPDASEAAHRLGIEELLAGIAALQARSHVNATAEGARLMRTVGRIVDAGADLVSAPCLGVPEQPDGGSWARALLGIAGDMAEGALSLTSRSVTLGPPPIPRGAMSEPRRHAESAVLEVAVLAAALTLTPLAAVVDPTAAAKVRARWAQLRTATRSAECLMTMCAAAGDTL